MVEQPIRNRQVASSTLALGSNIPFPCSGLRRCANGLSHAEIRQHGSHRGPHVFVVIAPAREELERH